MKAGAKRQPKPLANLKQQLAIAKRIVEGDHDRAKVNRLARLVIELNDWLFTNVADTVHRLDDIEVGLRELLETVNEIGWDEFLEVISEAEKRRRTKCGNS